ncbi:hypothetical protein GOP47_0014956 [Adiantum capillus-veneris]|uniref:BUB1 N-terminal domain-containing protein n=1 Tax=Adiantum capillus-veneris TaxID=13818 RepID=A0A9D4ZCN1_ADICA|nr:hypothetical protein GOP47_0014956 [Adiantum capillus-veneris]
MEWELSKENVQPLKEGRNVEKLNASLKARVEVAWKSKISEEHRQMVEAIDIYSGDDPLQPWIECIKWVKQSYPSGGSQSGLLRLLELCARTFCKDTRYADDIRYLKVWMDYADRCTNPRDIYTFLQDNNIAQQHAFFYEHCARFWEQQQKFPESRAIYELGIARKAEPLDSLKRAYTRFLQRVSRESASKDESQSPPAQSNRAFGTQITGKNRGLPLQQARKSNAFTTERGMPQQFSVYVDPDLRSNKSLPRPQGNKFISETEKNKENIQRASKWAGVKVAGASSTAAPRAASEVKLEVFKDDDELTLSKEPKPKKKSVPASRALRLDDSNSSSREEDKLKQNPLLYFEEDDLLI